MYLAAQPVIFIPSNDTNISVVASSLDPWSGQSRTKQQFSGHELCLLSTEAASPNDCALLSFNCVQ